MEPQNPYSGSSYNGNGAPREEDRRKFISSRRFTMAANIMGPVSLFIGGTLLSSVGVVCAILGWKKMKDLSVTGSSMALTAITALKASKVSVGVCIVALLLNVIAMALIMPEMLALLESGDYASIGSGTFSSSSSTWG